MKRFLTTTSVAACLAGFAAAPALAECKIVDPEADMARISDVEARGGYDAIMTRDLRRLRDAAEILNEYGKESACETVAGALREIADNPAESREARAGRNEAEEAEEKSETAEGNENQQAQRSYSERNKARMEKAERITESSMALNANEMIGADVQNSEGNDVGEVYNLVFSQKGEPAYVVVASGGFLGLGETLIAVPFEMMKVSKDRNVFYVPLSGEQLEDAPEFDEEEFSWSESEGWRKENNAYYQEQLKNTD